MKRSVPAPSLSWQLREQQLDYWSVSSDYDGETVTKNTFLHGIKVKVGGRSRAMSTPWCWSIPEEQRSTSTASGAHVGKDLDVGRERP